MLNRLLLMNYLRAKLKLKKLRTRPSRGKQAMKKHDMVARKTDRPIHIEKATQHPKNTMPRISKHPRAQETYQIWLAQLSKGQIAQNPMLPG
jgi:hypothetical protein